MSAQTVFRGDRMRQARKERGLTQDYLAQELGVTRTQMSNLEIGKSEPSMRTLALIAYLLNVSADWLIDLSVALPPPNDSVEPIPFMGVL